MIYNDIGFDILGGELLTKYVGVGHERNQADNNALHTQITQNHHSHQFVTTTRFIYQSLQLPSQSDSTVGHREAERATDKT